MKTVRKDLLVLVAITLAVMLAFACSDDSESATDGDQAGTVNEQEAGAVNDTTGADSGIDPGSPSAVVEKNLKAFEAGDCVTWAKTQYFESDSDQAEMVEQSLIEGCQESIAAYGTPSSGGFRITGEDVNGDEAQVTYTYTDSRTGESGEKTVTTKMVNGEWKIYVAGHPSI